MGIISQWIIETETRFVRSFRKTVCESVRFGIGLTKCDDILFLVTVKN